MRANIFRQIIRECVREALEEAGGGLVPIDAKKIEAEIQALETGRIKDTTPGYARTQRFHNLRHATLAKKNIAIKWRKEVLSHGLAHRRKSTVTLGWNHPVETTVFYRDGVPLFYLTRNGLYSWEPEYKIIS